jgi:hypothetical protein
MSMGTIAASSTSRGSESAGAKPSTSAYLHARHDEVAVSHY